LKAITVRFASSVGTKERFDFKRWCQSSGLGIGLYQPYLKAALGSRLHRMRSKTLIIGKEGDGISSSVKQRHSHGQIEYGMNCLIFRIIEYNVILPWRAGRGWSSCPDRSAFAQTVMILLMIQTTYSDTTGFPE
jgi:hypothetical protein